MQINAHNKRTRAKDKPRAIQLKTADPPESTGSQSSRRIRQRRSWEECVLMGWQALDIRRRPGRPGSSASECSAIPI